MEIIIEITVILNCSLLRSKNRDDIYSASPPLSPIPYTYILLGKGLLTDTVFAACPLLSSWKRRGRRCEHDVWSNSTWQPRRTTASVCVRAHARASYRRADTRRIPRLDIDGNNHRGMKIVRAPYCNGV